MAQIHDTDFSMKPSVDISGIASVLQRKRIAEIEAKQAQRAQRFQELTSTISLASNLATNMVEHSKEKQKQDFVRALSESMAATVPHTSQPMIGPLEENALRPAITAPDTTRQNLMRSATRVAPDQAAKHAFALSNPDLGADSLSFQRMTLPGTDGKNRTINVGVAGTQLINPITKKPFQGTPEEVDAMPEYGFVERESVIGTDESGEPIYHNPVSGTNYRKGPNGEQIPHYATPLPKLQNPGDAMVNKVQFIGESKDILDNIIDKFDGAFVGPVAGRVAPIKEWLSATTDANQSEFNSFLEEVDTIKRHELFGSALTVTEQNFFNRISLDTKVSPEAFLARLKAARHKLAIKEKNLRKSAKASGRVIRGSTTTAPSAETEADDFMNGLFGGE